MNNYLDIILAPVITEKSMGARQANVYTFKVIKTATKEQIKGIEKIIDSLKKKTK